MEGGGSMVALPGCAKPGQQEPERSTSGGLYSEVTQAHVHAVFMFM